MRLGELVTVRAVDVYISELTDREWTGQRQSELEKSVEKASQAVAEIHSNPILPISAQGLEELHDALHTISKVAWKYHFDRYKGLASEALSHVISLKVLPLVQSHSVHVMDNYFRGNAPFRTERCRDDIPDAFIAQAVLDLQNESDDGRPTYLVSSDVGFERLRYNDVVLVKKIDQIFDLDSLVRFKSGADATVSRLSDAATLAYIKEQLSSIIREQRNYIYGHGDWFGDSGDVAPVRWKAPIDTEIDVARASVWGGGWFSIPFRACQDTLFEIGRIGQPDDVIDSGCCDMHRCDISGRIGVRIANNHSKGKRGAEIDEVKLEDVYIELRAVLEASAAEIANIVGGVEPGWF